MATKTPKAKPEPKAKPLSIPEKLQAYGEQRVMDELANGKPMRHIAEEAEVSFGSLSVWIAADPDRSARAREARIHAARMWDEKAVSVIEEARDPFELSQAKELAHHYRWRASKTAPRDYGDKVTAELTGADGGPIQLSPTVIELVAPSVKSED